MKVAIRQTATDPLTGTIDMNVLTTGKSTEERREIAVLTEEIKKFLKSTNRTSCPISLIAKEIRRGTGKVRRGFNTNLTVYSFAEGYSGHDGRRGHSPVGAR